jgi:ATP-dependent DNA helicase RecQ
VKTGKTKPQKDLKNGYLKRANVSHKFDYSAPAEISGKSIILFDDIFDSGATTKEIVNVLTKYGAKKVAILVIARTVGGGYFGVMVPPVSVKQCHFERCYKYIKN